MSQGERTPLSRDRVLQAAVAIADADGLEAMTMRSLARSVGVQPMSLYHHVANKDDVLDGMVDLVYTEIVLRDGDELGWRAIMRDRSLSARAVLRRHPWAIALVNSRTTPGRATLAHLDAVIGTLRRAGFSVAMAAHAFALLDSYVFGFAVQEASMPFEGTEAAHDLAESIVGRLPEGAYPHLAELTAEHVMQPGYDFGDEFAFGLEIVLDGIERAAASDPGVDP
jgi:AcrR family transcriptional regulator